MGFTTLRRSRALSGVLLAVVTLAFAGAGAAAAEKTPEELVDSLIAPYDTLEGDAARLELCLEVLRKVPESDYTGPLLNAAEWHAKRIGRFDEVVAAAREIFGKLEAPDIVFAVGRFLAKAYGEMGQVGELDRVAARIEKVAEPSFDLYFSLVEAYAEAKRWDRVLRYAKQAEPFANAKAFKKDNPRTRLDEKGIEERGRHRMGLLLAYRGWAEANRGHEKKALELFERADRYTMHGYLGFSDSPLDVFWGRTLEKMGRTKRALEKFARKAVFEADEGALEAMKAVYVKLHGSEKGWEAYLDRMREKLAPTADDFVLEDYQGNTLKLSDLRGKVVLLGFWFPT
jgi:tetratricopeptide (TPR) repeat protein